jgi:hypothetical protein
MKKFLLSAYLLLLCSMLSGCGGGESSDNSTVSNMRANTQVSLEERSYSSETENPKAR